MKLQEKLLPALVLLLGLLGAGAVSGAGLSPVNITTTLVTAGKFINLVNLLQITRLEGVLMQKETSSGITLFAPTDDAFSNLPSGELPSLTLAQITSLLEYHVLPSYFTRPGLEAISGPSVLTLASDNTGKPSLNISTSSGILTLSTGVNSALVLSTLIDQYPLVAVYVINAVLLPSEIFPAGPGLTPPGTPGIAAPSSPGVSPSSQAPPIASSEAPRISPSPQAPEITPSQVPAVASRPNAPPLRGPELAPRPAPHVPAPFFRPFAPPDLGNLGNSPEAAPAPSSPSSGVSCLQTRGNLAVAIATSLVIWLTGASEIF